MTSTGKAVRRGAASVAALLLLAGCGADRVTDIASRDARDCKQSLTERIDSFSAASTAGTGAGSAQDWLGADKPKACAKLDEALAAKLVAELQAEYAARMSRQGSEISKQLTPAATPSPKR